MIKYIIVMLCLSAYSFQKIVEKEQGDCNIVDKRVCDGTVAKVRPDGTSIVCKGGKFQASPAKGRVGKKLGGDGESGDCEWYGQVYCDGDVVEDLFIWKHQVKCAQGKMFIYHRSLQEVESDPRFQELLKTRETEETSLEK
ncbi:uncharacterized protein LOC111700800 [Eurytemora carolleeae]|uniref:uncharacterized protein LOC111700800 n=1 Tax=Eurytemora carolleeae TaxID=1294199 RepID=UPI000C75C769|nr:uncharacterized protein LOC111700800 [Eurytemora carolleeae]|eukprot:XP_023327610.1 uncharacterized protein LOC111700800 [Eurytemora affinis]